MKIKKILSFVMAATLLMSITIIASARTNKPYRPEEDNLLKNEPREATAAAAGPLLGGKLLWNIESIYYYVDRSASGFSSEISAAARNWVYTGWGYNKLYPNTKTDNINISAIDIYGYSEYDNRNGYTYFVYRNSDGTTKTVDPKISNWSFNTIHLNHLYLDGKSATARQGTIGHEFGHAWGLAHNLDKNSIMCTAELGRKVYTVQQVDANAFNKIYP